MFSQLGPDEHPVGDHHPLADQPVRPLPDLGLRGRRGARPSSSRPPASTARASSAPSSRSRCRLLAPGIVTVLLFTVVATWNNYFLPLIMLSDPTWYPLTVGLNQWNAQATGVGGAADLQPRDHRLAAHDRPDRRRVPRPAALLAVGPERRKRQAVTARHRLSSPHPPLTRAVLPRSTAQRSERNTMSIARPPSGGPWRSSRPQPSAARSPPARPAAAPTRQPAPPTDLDAALEAGGKLTVLELDPQRRGAGRRVREGSTRRSTSSSSTPAPATTSTPSSQNAIKAGSGAPDVAQIEYYAHAAVRARRLARRPRRSTASATSRTSTPPRPGARVNDRRQALRPAAGLRPHGAVLQQDGLRPVRHRRADHVGRVRRRRAEAARGRPDEVHHQRHRRRRLHDEHDLAGRRPPVRDRRHATSPSTSPTRAPRSGPAPGTSSSQEDLLADHPRLERRVVQGPRRRHRSPRSSSAPGCPACSSRASPTPPATGASRPMPTYDGTAGHRGERRRRPVGR